MTGPGSRPRDTGLQPEGGTCPPCLSRTVLVWNQKSGRLHLGIRSVKRPGNSTRSWAQTRTQKERGPTSRPPAPAGRLVCSGRGGGGEGHRLPSIQPTIYSHHLPAAFPGHSASAGAGVGVAETGSTCTVGTRFWASLPASRPPELGLEFSPPRSTRRPPGDKPAPPSPAGPDPRTLLAAAPPQG